MAIEIKTPEELANLAADAITHSKHLRAMLVLRVQDPLSPTLVEVGLTLGSLIYYHGCGNHPELGWDNYGTKEDMDAANYFVDSLEPIESEDTYVEPKLPDVEGAYYDGWHAAKDRIVTILSRFPMQCAAITRHLRFLHPSQPIPELGEE